MNNSVKRVFVKIFQYAALAGWLGWTAIATCLGSFEMLKFIVWDLIGVMDGSFRREIALISVLIGCLSMGIAFHPKFKIGTGRSK